MKLPRDVSGDDLAKALKSLGYRVTRQTGSYLPLTTTEEGEHHVTVPRHNPLCIGTFVAILDGVAAHFEISRSELMERIKF